LPPKSRPLRFIAGADAIGLAERKIAEFQEQIDAYRDLSISPDIDNIQRESGIQN
jgi:hypothetical protein